MSWVTLHQNYQIDILGYPRVNHMYASLIWLASCRTWTTTALYNLAEEGKLAILILPHNIILKKNAICRIIHTSYSIAISFVMSLYGFTLQSVPHTVYMHRKIVTLLTCLISFPFLNEKYAFLLFMEKLYWGDCCCSLLRHMDAIEKISCSKDLPPCNTKFPQQGNSRGGLIRDCPFQNAVTMATSCQGKL